MKSLALSAFAAVLPFALTACNATITTGADTPIPNRPAAKSVAGRWEILSKTCGDRPAGFTGRPWLTIDPTTTYVGYVTTTEDDSIHTCRQIEGYRFAMQHASQTGTGSTSTNTQTGTLTKVAVRRTCYRKTSGRVDTTPYENQSRPVDDSGRFAEISQWHGDYFTLQTDHTDFCPYNRTSFSLKRI